MAAVHVEPPSGSRRVRLLQVVRSFAGKAREADADVRIDGLHRLVDRSQGADVADEVRPRVLLREVHLVQELHRRAAPPVAFDERAHERRQRVEMLVDGLGPVGNPVEDRQQLDAVALAGRQHEVERRVVLVDGIEHDRRIRLALHPVPFDVGANHLEATHPEPFARFLEVRILVLGDVRARAAGRQGGGERTARRQRGQRRARHPSLKLNCRHLLSPFVRSGKFHAASRSHYTIARPESPRKACNVVPRRA